MIIAAALGLITISYILGYIFGSSGKYIREDEYLDSEYPVYEQFEKKE
jgi:hypothetical protein